MSFNQYQGVGGTGTTCEKCFTSKLVVLNFRKKDNEDQRE